MTKSTIEQAWKVVAGKDDHCASIYVKDPTSSRSSFSGQKRAIPVHKAIAFNIEKTVAEYIVEAHNARVLWSPSEICYITEDNSGSMDGIDLAKAFK